MDLPHLESVTSMVAVGAGSRYENRKNNGISHFLEHMFFKGSRKYPSAEIISNLVDGIGAVNNAATSKEFTFYFIKSAAKHVDLASDILSSMIKEPLLSNEEINRERGVIIEEMRMYQDTPSRYVVDLYEELQFGDQPLGWKIIGSVETVEHISRNDFMDYMNSLYTPKNMALVYAGRIPKNIDEIAEKHFLDLTFKSKAEFEPYKKIKQVKPKIDIYHKKTDQVNLILGVEAYNRHSSKRYAAKVLAIILGEGMSSRLFREVREKRGLAYHVEAVFEPYIDTGVFLVYGGLKLEKIEEAVEVIKVELMKMTLEKVGEEELKKAKEMERGRTAIRSESTNFLAEYLGINFILDREIEPFEEYLKKIDAVTTEEVQEVAKELFKPECFNLQMIAPLKGTAPFGKILKS